MDRALRRKELESLEDFLMYQPPNHFMYMNGNPGYLFSQEKEQSLYWVTLEDKREWICQKFSIDAIIMNADGSQQSLLFSFKNRFDDDQQCQLDKGEITAGVKLFRQLADLGFVCSVQSSGRRLFRNYLLRAPVKNVLIRSERPGWIRNVYLLPEKTYSLGFSNLIYTGERSLFAGIDCSGSLQDWQRQISSLCTGNPILELSISFAFVGPLLKLLGMPAFFLHLCGPSRTGKTTALKISNSVWRGPEGLISWDMTQTSIEPELALSSDGVMYFTEIHLVDKKVVLPLVYQLTNGQSRLRRLRGGTDKYQHAVAAILSDGEKSLKELLLDSKQGYPDGLQSRLMDLKGWAEIFPCLNGAASAAALADQLGRAVREYHGTAADAFLEFLVKSTHDSLVEDYRNQEATYLEKISAKYFSGPIHMVAKQFFLIGFAGELATKAGVTGWRAGRAGQVAEAMFELWLKQTHGFGSRELLVMLCALEEYLRQQHSQIIPLENLTPHYLPPPDVVGFSKILLNETFFLLKYSSFKEHFSAQFDFKEFCRVLVDAGFLEADGLGKIYKTVRLPTSSSLPANYVKISNTLSESGVPTIVKIENNTFETLEPVT